MQIEITLLANEGADYSARDLGFLLHKHPDHVHAKKTSAGEREFKLGFEGLHRFVEGLPLSKVHECALAVLALESEPVDPRL